MTNSTNTKADPRGQQHHPVEIRLNHDENTLEVDYKSGEAISLPAELLRVESPSAEIQGHSPDEKKILGGRKEVAIMEIKPVGNYAIEIKFDDLHDTGIYSWDTLYDFGEHQNELWQGYIDELEKQGKSREPS